MKNQVDGSQGNAVQSDRASTDHLRLVRVNCEGIADRDMRLVDIVFRHGNSERFRYVRQDACAESPADIVIVNPFHPDGVRALAQARSGGTSVPTVSVVPAGSPARTNYMIHQERLGLELLPCLNRLMEQEFEAAEPGVGLLNTEQAARAEPAQLIEEPAADSPVQNIPEAAESVDESEPEPAMAKSDALVVHNDTLLIGLKPEVVSQFEQTIALSGQLLVGCTSLAEPSEALESIKAQETKFVVLARHLRGGSAFGLARRIRREHPDVVVLIVCEKQVLLDHVLAFFAGQVCLLSSRFGVKELTSAISKPLRQARALRRQSNRQIDWGNAHSPWLNTGTGQ
ncbi:MAG: hypothetical protein ACRBC3_20015 [Burkholderiaceae bacterium]